MSKAKKNSNNRPPIVAVLGHVDHGKTTLLDALRKTNFQGKEVGGITQSIGASVVKNKDGKEITFIDTPGHSAFEKMRSRGAKVADIVILVVASNDGVKPQTVEAIKHIRSTKTPFLVAITKIDLKNADTESVKGQIEKEEILLEGRGGDVPVVEVSAKTGKGLEDLLEMTLLLSEVSEIEGSSEEDLKAVVIETGKDKRGKTASVVLRSGRLKVGEEIGSEEQNIKIRGLFDEHGKSVKEIFSGKPALILGFSELPEVGSILFGGKKKTLSKARVVSKRNEVGEGEIAVVVKAQNAGSLEAVLTNIPEKAVVIYSGVGDATESDLFLAKSAGASLLVFEAGVSGSIKKLAKTEDVELFKFEIIYKLFEKIEELIEEKKEKILGEAEILASFPFNKKKVAGSRIKSGAIKKGDILTLIRRGEKIAKSRVVRIKKQKEDIGVAKEGEECGILLAPQLDFEIGDMLVSVAGPKDE